MSTEQGQGSRRGAGCGEELRFLATGPLIKMHKLSKQRDDDDDDDKSSMSSLPSVATPPSPHASASGYTLDSGLAANRGRHVWILLCMQSIFNYVA